ncbi:MAG: N-acetyl-gamma-glutamyl-phosphate reductase [Chitinophagaceae bacterium]|nr:MAG: N-acetyl-gamma-glutamyl-phosphate reductase [Chitinophagaceae bacterium]
MEKIKAAIIGATGYTGSELARLLLFHPNVEIVAITSESHSGKKFSDIHAQFTNMLDMPLCSVNDIDEQNIDVAFLALPHGVSMDYVKKFRNSSFKIIDFSGDFRLENKLVFESWYNMEHKYEVGFERFVYGLPELYKEVIQKADYVANPGCFPTGSLLALYPLLKNNLCEEKGVIIDAKTGTTGAGIKPSATTLFSNVNDNFAAYGLKKHRHTIEIEYHLSNLTNLNINLQFTPHILPVDRGILTSCYIKNAQKVTEQNLKDLYKSHYKEDPFIRMRENPPSLKDVRGTNFCDIYLTTDERTGNIIIVSAIDNLVKGASGQAVHNMNIMYGLEETKGLNQIALKP